MKQKREDNARRENRLKFWENDSRLKLSLWKKNSESGLQELTQKRKQYE